MMSGAAPRSTSQTENDKGPEFLNSGPLLAKRLLRYGGKSASRSNCLGALGEAKAQDGK